MVTKSAWKRKSGAARKSLARSVRFIGVDCLLGHQISPGASCGNSENSELCRSSCFPSILGIGRRCIAHVLKRDGYDSDSTHYLHSCRRHHNRAVTGLWLASLHDGKHRAERRIGIRTHTRARETIARHNFSAGHGHKTDTAI